MEVAEHRFRVMGSEAHILVVAGRDRSIGDGPVAAARAYLEHLEQRWSRFLPDSDVTRINLSSGRPVEVDTDTITLFVTMLDAWRLTHGGFDPTVLPAVMAIGYRASIDDPRRYTILPSDDLRLDGMGEIDIDPDRRAVIVPAGVVVDAGGIGKGLAADLTVARLLADGADGALVSIGGDLAMAGTPPDADGWLIAVEQPDPADGVLCTLAVSGGGVATSSTRSRRWTIGGQCRHHIIDPVAGSPSTTDLAAVTVIARSGWLAEAHATTALLSGSAHVIDYLDRHELTAIAVPGDGPPLVTADLKSVHLVAPSTWTMSGVR
jgi:thiamine biosynthesis lipoprotein